MSAQVRRKDSGIEWLGAVPAHWGLNYLGNLVHVAGGSTPSKENFDFWGGTIPWVSPKDMKREVLSDSEDHVTELALAKSSLRLIPSPVVLMVTRGMILDHTVPVALTSRAVTVNQDMKALRPRSGLSAEYLAHFLRAMNEALLARVEEAGHGTKALRTELWRKLPVLVPPEPEQRAIVAFLDRRTAAIDALIAKKERLIELLQEKRQALITQAVTKGLDPSVPMQDSGVEWIGAIPAHWRLEPLRHRWRIIDCKHTTPMYVDDGYPIVSTTEVKPGRLDLSTVTRRVGREDFVEMIAGGRTPRRGDIIYSRNASLGSAAYVDSDEPFGMGQDVVLITSRGQSQLFLAHVLNSPVGMTQVALACIGSTFKRINVSKIGEIVVPIPSYEEQLEIGTRVDEIDRIARERCARVQSSVNLLREYRQALITAAVTGRIDLSREPS